MYRILRKQALSENIKLMEIEAPLVARNAKAGQFIILRVDEKGERIPLTIADFNKEKGTITIIFAEVGYTTQKLGCLNEGDAVLDFVGPLGHESEIDNFGHVVCIGGGVGIAPMFPITRELYKAGNRVTSIIGARCKDLLFWEEEMRAVSQTLHVTTDDGSYGRHGFVTQVLQEMIDQGEKIDLVYAIGPLPMMRAVAEVTRPYGIKTIVSLNSIMVDGTGMCGACRVTVGGETKFTCVDGPEFDGHLVDFAEQMRRAQIFKDEEARARAAGSCGGGCGCH
ncbi:MAG: sulfide/dihydroorotate dehydrogenase-like FAD/NAD-binding protein [Bacillota bacterium]|uniref:Sulfide dehydrogenase (Flavoprotein) subunit SudB n=2 Tax=Carboxydocella TaxID=178898 RepID=A0A1T4NW65_9FIRM|nr:MULTISPECIES: sulfide/dihydroorotate dehydrogenase-like FAD/NAD-binding protein [Carboxydocella]AVX20150.1 NADH-dependent reduced ferredoxin:NADP oxidoreductase NfnA subunit [Carboxydocella thermautotrophica]AVX30569.1 NADH-dependent reduced ferredoxin:NADP oxidoreductase NfnA subunit [Carboxydocella thermautotrophica]SJZ83524.1 sulfide dehydrogenase (flavoprotein) subunit SudB [Carboxydocella sporoproducens DSM 16521]GAW28435.1 ferredoxin--NADP(+) reductase [Carboxydocella sp. ULO1]GAW3081